MDSTLLDADFFNHFPENERILTHVAAICLGGAASDASGGEHWRNLILDFLLGNGSQVAMGHHAFAVEYDCKGESATWVAESANQVEPGRVGHQ